MPDVQIPTAQMLEQVFITMKSVAEEHGAASARVYMGNGDLLVLRCGRNTASWLGGQIWDAYELQLDERTPIPPWLKRYAAAGDHTYGMVSRLMIGRLVDQCGGIARAIVEPNQPAKVLTYGFRVDTEELEAFQAAQEALLSQFRDRGVQLIRTTVYPGP